MSETASLTMIGNPRRALTDGDLDACLVHIYPRGPHMGKRLPLGLAPVVLGRGDGCEVQLSDSSVSRRHARIDPETNAFRVSDLGSTNGTFVNESPVSRPRLLRDGDYLRVGNCIYRYLAGGNVEAEYHEEIYRLTIIDGLTQIHNQRYLNEFLERELARSVRHRRPLAVLLFDLDRFKLVNDTHGHLCGDGVLRELSERVRGGVRREDLFARYGGEEFALVLVETDAAQASEVAERVRLEVCSAPFRFDAHSLDLSVSVGVAVTTGDPPLTPAELLKLADDNLYAAKRAGRNRVVVG